MSTNYFNPLQYLAAIGLLETDLPMDQLEAGAKIPPFQPKPIGPLHNNSTPLTPNRTTRNAAIAAVKQQKRIKAANAKKAAKAKKKAKAPG